MTPKTQGVCGVKTKRKNGKHPNHWTSWDPELLCPWPTDCWKTHYQKTNKNFQVPATATRRYSRSFTESLLYFSAAIMPFTTVIVCFFTCSMVGYWCSLTVGSFLVGCVLLRGVVMSLIVWVWPTRPLTSCWTSCAATSMPLPGNWGAVVWGAVVGILKLGCVAPLSTMGRGVGGCTSG